MKMGTKKKKTVRWSFISPAQKSIHTGNTSKEEICYYAVYHVRLRLDFGVPAAPWGPVSEARTNPSTYHEAYHQKFYFSGTA